MYRLGIDLGGTNIVAGVVDENYSVVAKSNIKTLAPRPAQEIADDMAKVAFEAIKRSGVTIDDISGFGIGTPGSVEAKTGKVIYANNLGFNNVPLADMMEERTGKKFFVANDADSAAYGEYIAGAGKGAKDFIMITLGTGVGGGIILDGKIRAGYNGAGGELGHTVIQMNGEACTCGRNGCFEAYASATALIRQTKQAMIKNSSSIMWEICDGDLLKVNGLTAFDAMRAGDETGKQVVDMYINYLSVGITNFINIFQPGILCIGGGISKEGDTIIKPLTRIVGSDNYARTIEKKTVIKAAQLGNDAGIIGAAYIGEQK
ncbi:MAG: ROK family protein [Clostridia bacterium]|nr:ROK family protein [Clostridia bacterium]